MRAPTQDDRAALKRLARYLVYRPRVVVCFDRQARQDTIDRYSDADWAGCPHSRKSTSSSYIKVGSHLLASSSTTHTVIATSSGESEFLCGCEDRIACSRRKHDGQGLGPHS